MVKNQFLKNSLITILLVLMSIAFLAIMPLKTFAAEAVASGACGAEGDNIIWTLDDSVRVPVTVNGIFIMH